MSATIYDQTATIASIAPAESKVVSFPATSFVVAGEHQIEAIAELSTDSNHPNDTISGSVSATEPIGGNINVGTGQAFTSLTNHGGVFEALNTAGISSNITINITSDLSAETGTVALNQLAEAGAGGYIVTIKPSGGARTISGTSTADSGLIILNGADRIVIDGSVSGGTDRSLTLINNQANQGTVVWMKSASVSNGTKSNTVKNCVISGASDANTMSFAGILSGSGVTPGLPAEASNNDNTIQNNWIYHVQNSVYLNGGAAEDVFDQNWTVTGNELGSSAAADKNGVRGILIANSANFTISNNIIHGIESFATTSSSTSGIHAALLVEGGTIIGNRIFDVKNVNPNNAGAYGIQVSTSSSASNLTIANNFIFDIAANGSSTLANNGYGLMFTGNGSGYRVYFNSINMNTNQPNGFTTAALYINSSIASSGALNVRGNIFVNSTTSGQRFAVYSGAPASVFAAINNNNYRAPFVGNIGATIYQSLNDWRIGTGQDVNSISFDPLWVSPTDLHIQSGSPMGGGGATGTGITTDIDGQNREATPDIGADELVSSPVPGSLRFSAATYNVAEAGTAAAVTVTRVGGNDGAVSVNYATSNGSAASGANCGSGVDYLPAAGTLSFASGEVSKTFNVTVCNDSIDESNETINLTLSAPTGGASLGSPASAVLTIIDDDTSSGTFSINDVRITEPNTGTVNAVFTVTYSDDSAPASVQFSTSNGRATAGQDYAAVNGTVTFGTPLNGSDQTSLSQTKTINVVISADVFKEANETFFVNLSNPVNGTITDAQGMGIIVDKDRSYSTDFDGDRRADLSVFRPDGSIWYILRSTTTTPDVFTFGDAAIDRPVLGDYDGDGKTDLAMWRASEGKWYILESGAGTVTTINWGVGEDKPVQADYDGDGKTDVAIYRPSTGDWWIRRSSNGATIALHFGLSEDKPMPGDYDGDFKSDIAIFRDGLWFIIRSSDDGITIERFGIEGDIPVSGDFDGDGKYDYGVYRNGGWWIVNSVTGNFSSFTWGLATDIPAPADFDGDGTTDIAVFRPSNGTWYVLQSASLTLVQVRWGQDGDVPLPTRTLPQ
jgi:hypothetical protein